MGSSAPIWAPPLMAAQISRSLKQLATEFIPPCAFTRYTPYSVIHSSHLVLSLP